MKLSKCALLADRRAQMNKEHKPLIKGGQGRSAEDIERSAAAVGVIVIVMSAAMFIAVLARCIA